MSLIVGLSVTNGSTPCSNGVSTTAVKEELDCYKLEEPHEYRGNISTIWSGEPCQFWSRLNPAVFIL